MMIKQTQKSPFIVRRVEIHVPSGEEELTYLSPAVGPDTYQLVGSQILKRSLAVPAGDVTALLVHAAYCSSAKDKPEFENVRELTRNNWLWVFNRNLWTDKGVYSVHDI